VKIALRLFESLTRLTAEFGRQRRPAGVNIALRLFESIHHGPPKFKNLPCGGFLVLGVN